MVYRYFEAALEDKAREWIEGSMLYEPGRTQRWRCLQPGALDADWGNLYRIARVELYRRVGTQYESPGDQGQAAWDAVVFHDKSSYEDVEQTLTKLNRARIKMVRAGRFVNTPDSVAREMSDIRR